MVLVALSLAGHGEAQEVPTTLDAELHHLGDSVLEAWADLVPAEPTPGPLVVEFGARSNRDEHVLQLRQRDVDDPWRIELNGTSLGELRRAKELRTEYYVVPPRVLKDGPNRLVFAPTKSTDDIMLGEVVLHRRPLREVLRLQRVAVEVRGPDGARLPVKISIARTADASPVELFAVEGAATAVRPGICYTADGDARFEVSPGRYRVFASRGFEWGVDRIDLEVPELPAGDARIDTLRLVVAPEVDTAGFVAADTHIHTVTHSGHGDASVEERMVTLAAEGVELAIATDHNHNIDYRPTQRQMGLGRWFTPVVGNEVTTEVGHINAFPLGAKDRIPDHRLTDWIQVVEDIRDRGAEVVILNHPRWPQIPTGPFGKFGLDRLTGELPGQRGVPFDAMELVNSTTLQPDPLFLFTDWFALLNHGVRMLAVGSSDSHTVGDPVGQGRTYVRSASDDPARIDVAKACAAFRAGDTSVSMGIFCDVTVGSPEASRRAVMGDTLEVGAAGAVARLRVAAPGWVTPREAICFVNGLESARQPVPSTADAPTDVMVEFAVPPRPHDAHLVFCVLGDGVKEPFWPTQMPYTIAATNPVWLDCDGERGWSSPRASGERIAAQAGDDAARLGAALATADDAVAIQALHAARRAWEKGTHVAGLKARVLAKLREAVGFAGDRPVLESYLDELAQD